MISLDSVSRMDRVSNEVRMRACIERELASIVDLEYCSAVWCSAADTHLKPLGRLVSGACFIAGGVLNCDLSHRRSVAVLCMLYKIRCNPKHPLCDALPVPYVPVRVTRGALIAHRYTFAPTRCRTSQYRRTFIPLCLSLE